MTLLINGVEQPSQREQISERNLMSSHHNDSSPQAQYDGSNTNGFAKLNVRHSQNGSSRLTNEQFSRKFPVNGLTTCKPVWDRKRRELRFGEIVVKHFKWPAENQEQILDAFEKHGWPDYIDDPLDAHPKICPKRRLHDTLKCLNRKQLFGAIKFRGDGTGRGVVLEIVAEK